MGIPNKPKPVRTTLDCIGLYCPMPVQKTREEMDSFRESSSHNRREGMMQMRELMDDQDKQIEALLTDDQKKLYQDIKKERREEMRKRRPGPPERGRGGRP